MTYSGVDRQLAQTLRSPALESLLRSFREFVSWARDQDDTDQA
jgi:hypothetical protein